MWHPHVSKIRLRAANVTTQVWFRQKINIEYVFEIFKNSNMFLSCHISRVWPRYVMYEKTVSPPPPINYKHKYLSPFKRNINKATFPEIEIFIGTSIFPWSKCPLTLDHPSLQLCACGVRVFLHGGQDLHSFSSKEAAFGLVLLIRLISSVGSRLDRLLLALWLALNLFFFGSLDLCCRVSSGSVTTSSLAGFESVLNLWLLWQIWDRLIGFLLLLWQT